MRRFIIFSVACSVVFFLACQNSMMKVSPETSPVTSTMRDYSEALKLAQSSISLLNGDSRTENLRVIKSGECVTTNISREGEVDTLMYIFNFENNAGFSIIAANAAFEPIIAVTEKGNYTFGEPTGVEGFDLFIEDIVSTLALPLDPSPEEIIRYRDIIRITDNAIGPLLTTKWGQSGIYGQFCPNGISGCVATAVTQVMGYHKKPNSLTLTTAINGLSIGSTVNLDWDAIVNHKWARESYPCNTDTHNQIGLLMREVGARLGMVYYEGSSGANTVNSANVLNNLGYNIETALTNIGTVGFEAINNSLDNYGPAIISARRDLGNGDTGGHAWVIDGYQFYQIAIDRYVLPLGVFGETPNFSDYVYDSTTISEESQLYHFNWGWDGTCDGYFSANIYNSSMADSYDNGDINNTLNRDYCLNIRVLINIH